MRVADECVPTSEPVLLRPTAGLLGHWSLGLVDGALLFSYVTRSERSDGAATVRAQWFGETLERATPDFYVADGLAVPTPEWTAHDGALWAQVWGERHRASLRPVREQIAVFRIATDSDVPERLQPAATLPITSQLDGSDLTPASIGAPAASAGIEGRAPAVTATDGPVFALTAIPADCPGDAVSNFSRLILFDGETTTIDLSGPDPCALDGAVLAHDMRLVSLRDGGLAIFFRQGFAMGQGHLYYSRVDSDLRLVDTPPRQVDFTTIPWSIPGGFQPQAVALGDGTLLFTLRNADSSTNECQDLRLVELDGSNPRDAPYEMPCHPPQGALRLMQNGPALSAWVIVQPLSFGHAVMAYGERTNYSPPGTEYARRLTATTPWEEGVFLHTIDEAGRRASEIVRVTAPESTAMVNPTTPRTDTDGPFPGEFEVQAVSEGDRVVVAWRDNRPDAPGYYARSFRCTPLPE